MKYIYGPLHSRRLGLSLGVSLSAGKICNFDCIYCQLGKAKQKVAERKVYALVEDVIAELRSWLQNNPGEAANLSYVTISGLGEPTLHSDISSIIKEIKLLAPVKVAVITNASFVGDEAVRRALLEADLLVPSLDAAEQKIFEAIDRPAAGVMLEEIIEGLVKLRKEFRGKIWLEVMLVKGFNDSLEHVRKLKDAIERINPDKIQLNSPARTTAEKDVVAVEKSKLEKIREIFGDRCQIV